MGNTILKEQENYRRPRGLSASSGGAIGGGSTIGLPFSQPAAILKKIRKDREKQKQREEHAWNLIVRYEESVDGGFLAPYGTYKSNLDYNTEIVRSLIVERKLAPFFSPLQDFDPSWSDDELLVVLDQLTLHVPPSMEAEEEEEEDMDSHKLRRSAQSLRRMESKKNKEKVRQKLLKWQEEAELKYVQDKKLALLNRKAAVTQYPYLPSNDLKLKLYREAQECPICFVYYPPYLNISRCCIQPICTECFVQIKRLDPHPPHDENGNETDTEDPELLISESAKCPFCAMSDFGVTYYAPNYRVGIDGVAPAQYKSNETTTIHEEEGVKPQQVPIGRRSIGDAIHKTHSAVGTPPKHSSSPPVVSPSPPRFSHSNSSIDVSVSRLEPEESERVRRRRQGSIPPDAPGVITTDFIRPDWENRLKNARLKIARRSAAASAIHATSLIMSPNDEMTNNNTNHEDNEYGRNGNAGARRSRSDTLELEERMIEEALRLSLLEQDRKEEEERRKKR